MGDVDNMTACMWKGGSPILKFQSNLVRYRGELPSAAFMDVVPEALGLDRVGTFELLRS